MKTVAANSTDNKANLYLRTSLPSLYHITLVLKWRKETEYCGDLCSVLFLTAGPALPSGIKPLLRAENYLAV